jgi:hypothetical protein
VVTQALLGGPSTSLLGVMMSRAHRVALLSEAVLVLIVLVAFFACTYPRSAESLANASEDSYAVWIALLKGFNGEVIYVGSDDAHAYFRIGRFFGTYYKLPACAVRLPETFPVGHGKPYVVQLHVEHGEIRVVSDCAKNEGYALGQVDRKSAP